MKKILFTLTLLLAICMSPLKAETVSQKQAQEMARQFFNETAGRVVAPPKLIYNGRKLTTARLFTPFYVYNNPVGGFVIISAENKAFPILGFSLKDNFDPELLGKTELALLSSYAREIELVRYDSSPIESVEHAWQNYPEYVKSVLSARYEATDPVITLKETDRILDNAIEDDSAIFSDIYTPDQWREMMTDELKTKQSVPLWLISGDDALPAVIYGSQGDYFRIEMSRLNSWLMRLNATENISSNMVSAVVNPIFLEDGVREEPPFADYDSFAEEVTDHEAKRRAVAHVDTALMYEIPRIRPLGGAHYEITLPDDIALLRIFNLSGSMVRRFTISGSPVANIDLSAETPGFYVINAVDQNGQSYGFKVYR